MLEVEQKFRVDDPEEIYRRIDDVLDIETCLNLEEQDWYFSHPDRDFGVTDEALRIRRTRANGDSPASRTLITFKGPRLDAENKGRNFKTRREIELPVGEDASDADQLREMLHMLGFGDAGTVHKRRRRLISHWQGWRVEFALDEVDELGAFAEIEIVADHGNLQEAQQVITELAERLDLVDPITSSYRNMLHQ